jgi:hypothetical protein
MKVTRFLLSALFLGAMATAASAQGIASISWNSCTPGPANLDILPGTQASLYASVIGQSQPHTGYEVQVALGSGSAGALRDAWRFDGDGCQGSSFITIDHLAPAAVVKACPTFSGTQSVLQIKQYNYDAGTGKAVALCANAYPQGGTGTTNPALRYFLARFLFDHTYSVNGPTTPGADCGGLEVPVCAHLRVAKWNTVAPPGGVAQEVPWAIGQEYVTSRDPQNASGCPGATPAVSKTWGSLKAQYKH